MTARHRTQVTAPRDRAHALGLIDQAPVAVIVTDRKGQIASWNAAAEQLLGWTRAQMLGRPLTSMAAAESVEAIAEIVKEAVAGRASDRVLELRDPGGHPLFVHLRSAPLLDAHGKRVGVVIGALNANLEPGQTRQQGTDARAIGRRIAQARKEAGFTQRQLADRLVVTSRSVQSYESGAVVPYKRLNALAEILKQPVSWFLSGEASKPAAGYNDLRSDIRELLHEELSDLVGRTDSPAA